MEFTYSVVWQLEDTPFSARMEKLAGGGLLPETFEVCGVDLVVLIRVTAPLHSIAMAGWLATQQLVVSCVLHSGPYVYHLFYRYVCVWVGVSAW